MVEAEAFRWASRGRSTHPTRAARQRLTWCRSCDPGPNGDGGQTVVDHIRLFPLREDVRWNYAVHEQTRSKGSRLPATAKKFDPLEHGIADRKAAGNQQIVRPSHAENPMRVRAPPINQPAHCSQIRAV